MSGIVGAMDGKTYILTGSSNIRVYNAKTGASLGTFDTYSDYDSLCSFVSWTSATLSAFRSCQTISISYQAPKAVLGNCIWVTTDGKTLHTVSAASVSGYTYIKPNQSITIAYNSSDYTPAGYTYKKMMYDGTESTVRTAYSKLYNYTTDSVDVSFVYEKTPANGSITVNAYDGDTMQLIPSALIQCGTHSSSTNPATFSALPFGQYSASATAAGYEPASGSTTISATAPNKSIDLLLCRNSGSVTVNVVDSSNGKPISSAGISGAASGSTDASGQCTFSGIDFYGSKTFTASASGYYSNSGTTTLSRTKLNDSITIALTPIPKTGDFTVTVRDSSTNKVISGASVSGAGKSGSTGSDGTVTFNDVPFGSYTFTASASKYYSGTSSGSISLSSRADSVTIYLDPIPTTGDITVTVCDSATNRAICGASVSGAGKSGSTGSDGMVTFSDIPFGNYSFSASAGGYYSGSSSGSISFSSMTDNVTIYLDLIPTSGDITVYVRDSDTGGAISGAAVRSGSLSGTTNSNGKAVFYNLSFGTYTFSASADGYYSASASGSISVSSTEKTVTIYLEKLKTDLSIDSSLNGKVYKGSTIIVPATIYNDGDIDFTPSKPVSVTMTAKMNSGTVFDTQTASVICPANDSNLVWFQVTVPDTNSVTFDFKVTAPSGVSESNLVNNAKSITATVYNLPNRNAPDAKFELNAPGSFSYSKYSGNTSDSLSWSIYEWDGVFVKRTYTAKLSISAKLYPDATAGYRKEVSGIWTTRSGYGVGTEANVNIIGNTVGTAKVDVFYPEYNYSTEASKSDRLELFDGSYVFKVNSGSVSDARFHGVPLWFPDKAYSVKYYVYDVWCPAGMLTGYTNAYVNISGSMYDDLYTN